MASEVEKMYENYNIKPKQKGYCDWGDYCPRPYNKCDDECPSWIAEVKYQPFTAEKQLELIKLIANRKGYPDYEYFGNLFDDYIQLLDFNEALAKLVNTLWQDLTEEERQQIREILE